MYQSYTRPDYSYAARNVALGRNLGTRIKGSVIKKDIDKMKSRITVLESEMNRRGVLP